jgi:hypothetical protein
LGGVADAGVQEDVEKCAATTCLTMLTGENNTARLHDCRYNVLAIDMDIVLVFKRIREVITTNDNKNKNNNKTILKYIYIY